MLQFCNAVLAFLLKAWWSWTFPFAMIQLSDHDLSLNYYTYSKFEIPFFFSGRSFVRYSGPRTKLQWKCTHVKSSWRRMEGKSARLRKMRFSSWRCELLRGFSFCVMKCFLICFVLIPSSKVCHFFFFFVLFLNSSSSWISFHRHLISHSASISKKKN